MSQEFRVSPPTTPHHTTEHNRTHQQDDDNDDENDGKVSDGSPVVADTTRHHRFIYAIIEPTVGMSTETDCIMLLFFC